MNALFGKATLRVVSVYHTYPNPQYFSTTAQCSRGRSSLPEHLRDLPKRPQSLGLLGRLYKDVNQQIHAENPGSSQREVMKLAAEYYRNLSADEKAELLDKYRAIYEKEKEQFQSLPQEVKERVYQAEQMLADIKRKDLKKKAEKKLEKPKNRPASIFALYVRDWWKANYTKASSLKFKESSQLIRKDYGNLADSEVQDYKDQLDEIRKRYAEEMKAWASRMVEDGKLDVVPNKYLTREQLKQKRQTASTALKSARKAIVSAEC